MLKMSVFPGQIAHSPVQTIHICFGCANSFVSFVYNVLRRNVSEHMVCSLLLHFALHTAQQRASTKFSHQRAKTMPNENSNALRWGDRRISGTRPCIITTSVILPNFVRTLPLTRNMSHSRDSHFSPSKMLIPSKQPNFPGKTPNKMCRTLMAW